VVIGVIRSAIVLLPVAAISSSLYAPARLLVLAAAGRATGCPLKNAVQSHEYQRLQNEIMDRIFRATQVIERDSAGFSLLKTPQGSYWVPPGNNEVAGLLAEQELNVYGTGERGVRAGDIVLDCGANVGVFTRKALWMGAQVVVAIEPNPEGVECLRRNFGSAIAVQRVIVCPKGVWDREDSLDLMVSRSDPAMDSFVVRQPGLRAGPRVPLTTIDKLVDELKLPRVDFIKMDIEGAEQRALAGARGTVAKYRPRLAISAYHLPDDAVQIPNLVRAARADYRMECGPCEDLGTRILPLVYHFW
jgi:FkbM family methyltransferase